MLASRTVAVLAAVGTTSWARMGAARVEIPRRVETASLLNMILDRERTNRGDELSQKLSGSNSRYRRFD